MILICSEWPISSITKTTDVLSFSILQRAGTEGGGKTSRLANFESQSWFSPRSLFCSLICPNSPLFDFRTGNASFTPFSLGRRCQMIMIRVEHNPHPLCATTFRNYYIFLKLESWHDHRPGRSGLWKLASSNCPFQGHRVFVSGRMSLKLVVGLSGRLMRCPPVNNWSAVNTKFPLLKHHPPS